MTAVGRDEGHGDRHCNQHCGAGKHCCIYWTVLVSAALVAMRLLMVVFFWVDALERLSSDVAICWACSMSVAAWFAPNGESPAIMCLRSRISA